MRSAKCYNVDRNKGSRQAAEREGMEMGTHYDGAHNSSGAAATLHPAASLRSSLAADPGPFDVSGCGAAANAHGTERGANVLCLLDSQIRPGLPRSANSSHSLTSLDMQDGSGMRGGSMQYVQNCATRRPDEQVGTAVLLQSAPRTDPRQDLKRGGAKAVRGERGAHFSSRSPDMGARRVELRGHGAGRAGMNHLEYVEAMHNDRQITVLDRTAGVEGECAVKTPPAMACSACGARLSSYNALSRKRGVCALCDLQSRRPSALIDRPTHPPEFMTRDEAAEYLHLCGEMVRRKVVNGTLLRGNWGKKRLITRESVERYAYIKSLQGGQA